MKAMIFSWFFHEFFMNFSWIFHEFFHEFFMNFSCFFPLIIYKANFVLIRSLLYRKLLRRARLHFSQNLALYSKNTRPKRYAVKIHQNQATLSGAPHLRITSGSPQDCIKFPTPLARARARSKKKKQPDELRSAWKFNQEAYTTPPTGPQKLISIRADFEELWSKQVS